jgi:hypothetical protein
MLSRVLSISRGPTGGKPLSKNDLIGEIPETTYGAVTKFQ